MGSITNLAKASSGFGIPSFGIPVLSGIGVHNERVKATIDIKIVEVNTGNLFFADTADGLAKKSRTNFIISGVTVTNSEFNGLEVNAILKASVALAPKIEKAITGYDTLTEKLKAETKASRKKKVKTKTESETDTSKQETKQETKQELKPETEKIPETRTETTSANTTEPENKSTDPAKVINSYGLPSGESNVLRIKHINLKKQGNKKNVYQEYTELFESFNGDYFAAFRAGEVALSMGDETNAKLWFEKSLSVNPNYEPAKKALEKLSDTKTDSNPKPKTKPKTKRKR